MNISERLSKVMARVSLAAARAGRNTSDIRILFATKYATAWQIAELGRLEPHLLIGENRVQDAEEKFSSLRELLGNQKFSKIEKHMIGTLQSNKATRAVELFSCIQSVDSLQIAEKISLHAAQAGKEMAVFIEVNNGEAGKRGVLPSGLPLLIAHIQKLPNMKLAGLMGMGTDGNEKATRDFFRLLRREATKRKLLCSMGMSSDFEIAIEEGSDMVRIGSAIFKE